MLLGLGLLALSCGDLFHDTDWASRCEGATCAGGGAGGSGAAGGVGASGGAGQGAVGGGGEGGCTPGEKATCYTGPAGTLGVGLCKAGTKTCNQEGTAYGACAGQITPVPEQCETALDESCDGTLMDGCGPVLSCGDLTGQPSGVYSIDPDGGDPSNAFDVRCDMDTDGGGWALVYNSIGSSSGVTPAFWQIAYADRLGVKGKPELYENFYAGALYPVGKEYRDELVDLADTPAEIVRATATGFDSDAMVFAAPALVTGLQSPYDCQFAAGWSSSDHDGDPHPDSNCATIYLGVTQHYCACWYYNLGSDADAPFDDGSWGPHVNTEVFAPLGLSGDGSGYTRVKRIARWTRW